ncbi:Prolyl oligopeptidase family protein [Chryseobacterium ureilyticum]|uniref:Prolyl oligopeptidase family protein n=1 Tax=Chryseobacterium ureilyticum TaxID=373668 RepID=A0A1N7L966_9FLAO|nr:prolyl oligopeptidase family serine peptidase [Chryseobacterium ureilyticum]SIS70230.1 Prolyl oligopeptidase family protein [Chryseobacterium ureilyticum]
MVTKWIMKLLLFILLWLMVGEFSGQEDSKDTMDHWLSGFYGTEGGAMSPDGRWVVMKKDYKDKDSLFIFDTQDKKNSHNIAEQASMGTFHFGHYAMLAGGDNVLWVNLITRVREEYQHVKQSSVWSSDGYCILNTLGELQVMDKEGKILVGDKDIVYYLTDGKGNLFAERKTDSGYDILKLEGKEFKKLISLAELERMELTDSGHYLVIYKQSRRKGFRNLMVMNVLSGKWFYPLGEQDMQADFIRFQEGGKELSCLIEAVNLVPYPEKEVQIWYGSDRDLESRERGSKKSRKYWIWNPERDKAVSLDVEEEETVSSIGNDRYFVVFKSDEMQDYIHHIPDLNISLYTVQTGERNKIGIVRPLLVSSEDGGHLLMMDSTGLWQLLNVETFEKRSIEGLGLKKPYFSKDARTIYFESDNGLWIYAVGNGRLYADTAGLGGKVEILGGRQHPLCTGFNFYQNFIEDNSVLLKVSDQEKEELSYHRLKNKKNTILYSSGENVKSVSFSDDGQKMSVLEENFNSPPKLWMIDTQRKQKELVFDAAVSDPQAKLLKQQIVSYTSSSGLPLKGTLYYPLHYDPSRQYPLIVHIYQKQSDKASTYLLPRYNEVGFNIRILLERGYFVYLPDCITEKGAPGWSGLDCVNRSLDALTEYHLKIDKIGLIGHSFGSYLTNFIATHSNRFSAYISGSGVSDLVSSYFSYNNNYSSPHYWQLETGQYEIGRSFFQDKELYLKNSPVLNADKLSAPILLWTGLKDRNVVPEQTVEFYMALRRSSKQVIALLYPDHGHDLGIGTQEARDLNRRILEWWDYFLKGKSESTWISKEMKKDAD